MSNKMTPCEKLGYKVGDEFEVISHHAFKKGQVVTLHEDDGTECPLFAGDGGGAGVFDGVECSFATLNKQVREIANKLKPAKQALADAIHQSGGWADGAEYAAQCKSDMTISFYRDLPDRNGDYWCGDHIDGVDVKVSKLTNNWHHTILSRDEYFTAYPETVKIEINNETEHKVEVEMKSESEMTIKVGGDWHKNGELPPVGEVCEMKHKHSAADWARPGFDPVVIVASGKDLFIVSGTDVYRETVGSWDEYEFRPIRTEREKAIDEMVCEFIDHYGDPKCGERCIGIATKLYDAGYRREVK